MHLFHLYRSGLFVGSVWACDRESALASATARHAYADEAYCVLGTRRYL